MNTFIKTLLVIGVMMIIPAVWLSFENHTLLCVSLYFISLASMISMFNLRHNDSEDIDMEKFLKHLDTYDPKSTFVDKTMIKFISTTKSKGVLNELLEGWDDINEEDPLEEEHHANALGMPLDKYRKERSDHLILLKTLVNKRLNQLNR